MTLYGLDSVQEQTRRRCRISMGDEGKGRLISEIAEEVRQDTGRPDCVAMVLKVNGGANSGHTAGGLKLNLLPAGVVRNREGVMS